MDIQEYKDAVTAATCAQYTARAATSAASEAYQAMIASYHERFLAINALVKYCLTVDAYYAQQYIYHHTMLTTEGYGLQSVATYVERMCESCGDHATVRRLRIAEKKMTEAVAARKIASDNESAAYNILEDMRKRVEQLEEEIAQK